MNEPSKIYKFVINRFKEDELVNTVSIVDTDEMDNNNENIYPLVNIDLQTSEVLSDAIVFNFIITIVQERDVIPDKTDSKLLTDINFIDNINETHTISTKFINNLTFKNNDENIEIDELSDLTILKDWRTGLDGVQFEINLSIHNETSGC